MQIAIITYCRREDGHPGGVPKWAWYLKRALEESAQVENRCGVPPEVEQESESAQVGNLRHQPQIGNPAGGSGQVRCHVQVGHYAWRDYPGWQRCDRLPEHEKARLLSEHLAGTGPDRARQGWAQCPAPLRDYDHIIADGFWASGLPDDAPATVVCHGTWAGLAAACGGVARELIDAQGEAYRRFPVVAVSRAAARQVERYHGVRVAAIIPNGVDLGVFRPAERSANRPPVALYAGKGYGKGEDIVREVARELHGKVRVEYLNAAIGMEARAFQRGDVFLFPSRHEGDSYALKEALACGLPVVASAVGALEDERPPEIGEVVEGFAPEDYCAAMWRVLVNREAYQPRAWAERNADYREFARRWREYLADGARANRPAAET